MWSSDWDSVSVHFIHINQRQDLRRDGSRAKENKEFVKWYNALGGTQLEEMPERGTEHEKKYESFLELKPCALMILCVACTAYICMMKVPQIKKEIERNMHLLQDI